MYRVAGRARRFRMVLLIVAALVASQLVPLAMWTTIVPPSRPVDPVTVFLVDFGTTPSLVLPDDEGGLIAYAYGDWRYYALGRQGPYESIAAVLWPTQGALGRKPLPGPASANRVRTGIGVQVQHVYALDVERDRVVRLRTMLEQLHRENLGTTTESYGMTFVHHPQPYTYWTNSNRMTAEWLRALGCELRGPALASRWRVEERASADAMR